MGPVGAGFEHWGFKGASKYRKYILFLTIYIRRIKVKKIISSSFVYGALVVVLGLGMMVLPSGCTQTEQGAGTGAIIGAGLGGIIGHQSGRGLEGAAIGAAAGTIGGGLVGQQKDKEMAAGGAQSQMQVARCPNCGAEVDVTGFASGTKLRCPKCNGLFQL
jgi:hypothetical protein